MSWVEGPVRVRVPATSANLGPGFDSLGLALSLYDMVTGEVTGPAVGDAVAVEVIGQGADTVPRDEGHLVHRSMRCAFDRLGVDAPAVRLRCRNAIPHGRGLGSSSAAIVAGLAIGRALVADGERRLDDSSLFALAAELEGHPDNVAPAVFGGFTVAWDERGARAVSLRVSIPLHLRALVPPTPLATPVARGLLPEVVPHQDAAHNAGRTALLTAVLTGRAEGDLTELLLAATQDRVHQDYREPVMPASLEVVGTLRRSGVPAVVSGAGPTVLALVPSSGRGGADESRAAELLTEIAASVLPDWQLLELDVDPGGVRSG